MPTSLARDIQAGGLDANGQLAQVQTAEGKQNRCRHCLGLIAEGEPLLLFSYRPFNSLNPYSETGPVFLHQSKCQQYIGSTFPEGFEGLEPAIVRGYDHADRICYNTGRVISGLALYNGCLDILADENIAYVHIRSKYNCF